MISRNGIERKTAKRFDPDGSMVGQAGQAAAGTVNALNEAPYAAGTSGFRHRGAHLVLWRLSSD
jgi:hypothetical protein